MADVVLVNTPWGEYTRPSMQLGLIQALLQQAGLSCHTDHSVLRFAEAVGESDYKRAEDLHRPFAEWVFTAAAFGQPEGCEPLFYSRLSDDGVPRADRETLRRLRASVPLFVEQTVAAVLDRDPRIVGFTTAMLQTTAAAAVARRLKAVAPHIFIVFGGAHCEAATVNALMQAFPCVDVAVTEQCDAWVGDLFRRLLDGETIGEMRGIAFRDGEIIHRTEGGAVFAALDTNPLPNFDDYFAQLDASPFRSKFMRSIPFEGSRGCWWGQRRHCRFCGLNGTTMTYRHRSAEAVVEELVTQRARHDVDTFIAVDEIIPKRFFHELPAVIAARLPGAAIFYEMSPSVPRHQLERLASVCHLFSQPGIEHLSDPVLERIGKGISAAHNVALLRRAEEFEIGLLWNLIFGIPGERRADYLTMLDQMTSLHHLQPPNLIPLTLARYSPYHAKPEAFGLRQTGPQRGLDLAYPVDAETLNGLALNFEYAPIASSDECPKEALADAIGAWTADRNGGARLDAILTGDQVEILDSRCTERRHQLCQISSFVYRNLESPVAQTAIAGLVRRRRPDLYLAAGGRAGLDNIVQSLRNNRLIWTSGGMAVAVAVPRMPEFWLGLRRPVAEPTSCRAAE
ncbi:RiPP maturation radical SAM C-methyltransferase [Bradyrhizobium sp. HKCCYLRH3061]|uniref:RiPP maturation radical SAM C-methyltransferase n=1 Tax=Bradyrhizobium sp. HKCCYLRH3061 TaxID=3420734 RepID=UPI003EB98B2F